MGRHWEAHSDKMQHMEFDLPTEQNSIIKVIGVGGGGGNAVNYMYREGIAGVDFLICNTDSQALEASPIPNKIQMGNELTEGRGAGSNPEVGKQAAEDSIEDVMNMRDTKDDDGYHEIKDDNDVEFKEINEGVSEELRQMETEMEDVLQDAMEAVCSMDE